MHRLRGRERLSSMIAAGETPLGAFITSSDPSTSVILGDVGFDFIVIDDEHGVLGARDILNHVRSAQATSMLSLVRVAAGEQRLIQAALDIGCDGVIVPKVSTADQMRRAVRASRYRGGGRGMCSVVPATRWSQDGWSDFVDTSDAQVLVIPLIETTEGCRNFAEIVAVEGVAFAFFGFADLANDLGIDMYADRDQLLPRWQELRAQASRQGVPLGVPLGAGFDGADWGTVTGDLNLLRTSAKAALADGRTRFAHVTP
jgi:2-keto-3-deoxy-L-rhamnonate aldolase RhmA